MAISIKVKPDWLRFMVSFSRSKFIVLQLPISNDRAMRGNTLETRASSGIQLGRAEALAGAVR
jgi:hypothetical protein